nr:helix-turn-helix domain-containing protein [Micromonospora sp. DSM 115978]
MAGSRASVRSEQRDLRERMLALGLGHDEVAAEFARRYQMRPRAAYRHAHGWTLNQAADRVNACAVTVGLDEGGKASITASRLCEYEQWPASSGRKPTPRVLALLARTYGTQLHRLLDVEDHEHLGPGERILLDGETRGRADSPSDSDRNDDRGRASPDNRSDHGSDRRSDDRGTARSGLDAAHEPAVD